MWGSFPALISSVTRVSLWIMYFEVILQQIKKIYSYVTKPSSTFEDGITTNI